VILVFSIFALLKINSGAKQAPAEELITGSIQRSPASGKTPSSDPMTSFLDPAASQPTPRLVQSAVVVREPVPLPRPWPNRL
jgi:hypothetical protein